MSYKILLVGSLVLLAIGLSIAVVDAQRPPPGGRRAPAALAGTGFTYQGQLKNNGALVNGTCDLAFRLFDDPSAGNQVGAPLTYTIPITSGLFTTQLDFGGVISGGVAVWLDLRVGCPSPAGSFTTLTPRQALTPAPMAFALPGLYTQQNATSPNVIGGFSGNVITPSLVGATIAGGGVSGNPNRAWANYAAVGGGSGNAASSQYATIGGGEHNIASSDHATIAGGGFNAATGSFYSTIGGGYGNIANAQDATIGGGSGNTASAFRSAIGGGNGNLIAVTGTNAFIGGGTFNTISNTYATIGGGYGNTASGNIATISGGVNNTASGPYATVGGGFLNTASSDSSAVGGGYSNTVSNFNATVGGGAYNTASGYRATVGGGNSNHASGDTSTVGGGALNTASNQYATIGGGAYITASGYAATVPGGYYNNATMSYTLAAGNRAKANHQGSFVWADSTSADFASTGNDQFLIRANGGVGIGTTSPAPASALDVNGMIRVGVLGSGFAPLCYDGLNFISSCVSSVRYKRNIADLNLGLATVEQLRPVTFDWKRTGEHDLGFVAEEVDAVAPLLTTRNSAGEIEGVKYDRVTAVLVNAVQEQQRQIVELTRQNAMLKNQNTSLEARLTAVEQANRDPKGFAERPRSSKTLSGANGEAERGGNPSGLGDWNAAIALVIGAVGVIAIERARKGGAR